MIKKIISILIFIFILIGCSTMYKFNGTNIRKVKINMNLTNQEDSLNIYSIDSISKLDSLKLDSLKIKPIVLHEDKPKTKDKLDTTENKEPIVLDTVKPQEIPIIIPIVSEDTLKPEVLAIKDSIDKLDKKNVKEILGSPTLYNIDSALSSKNDLLNNTNPDIQKETKKSENNNSNIITITFISILLILIYINEYYNKKNKSKNKKLD